jgi:uncharacterized membrane protein YphA (DoxX/SURF4 family)
MGIPQFFTSNFIAALFADILLFTSCVALIIWPKKYYLAIVFTISYWLNYMGYCLVNAYQPSVFAPLLLCLPAMFKDELKFSLTFWAVRFWACFLYFEAGFLKILRGGIFNPEQMVNSIKLSVPAYLSQNASTGFRSEFRYFLMQSPTISQCLFVVATLLELCFLIGFFTKKYDLFLLFLFLAFHITNQYILNMPFLNHQVLFVCCFIPWHKLNSCLSSSSLRKSEIEIKQHQTT